MLPKIPVASSGNGRQPNSPANWRNLARLSPGIDAAAAQMLAALFPLVNPASTHLCSFAGDPEAQWPGKWTGGRLGDGYRLRADENHYFSVAELRPGTSGRTNALVDRDHLIVADDIGEKGGSDRVERLRQLGFLPTTVVETHSGSRQFAFRLTDPVEAGDAEGQRLLRAVRARLADGNFGDKSVKDRARYMRLPSGINGKPKYGSPSPRPRLVECEPARSVDLAAFAAAIGTSVADGEPPTVARPVLTASTGSATRAAAMDHPYVQLAAAAGLQPHLTRRNVVEAICPNAAAHTPGMGAATGFAFIDFERCKCHHDACSDLDSAAYERLIRQRYDERVEADIAQGVVVEDAETGLLRDANGASVPRTASNFLAQLAFAQHPLTEEDRQVVAGLSSKKQEPHGGTKTSAAEEALERLKHAGATFFNTIQGQAYVAFRGRVLAVETSAGMRWISAWLKQTGKLPLLGGKTALRELMVAEAFGPTERVHFRCAAAPSIRPQSLYVNLMDGDGHVVEIAAGGWRVIDKSSLLIRLADRVGGLPLPMPVRAGDGVNFIERFERHARLSPVLKKSASDENLQDRAGLIMFIVAQIRRDGEVPHLLIAGPNGSAKSSFARRLKQLTDPDEVDMVQSLPEDDAGLFSVVTEQTSLVLDNISKLTNEQMDQHCALATGTAHQRRTLYETYGRSFVKGFLSLIYTSIVTDLASRPDLLDRLVSISLPLIPPNERKLKSDLDEAWERDLPFLLGDLFDMLAGALAIESQVRASVIAADLPRLADAALFAECCARAAGWPDGLCLDAINASRHSSNDQRLAGDPVAQGIREQLGKDPDSLRDKTAGEVLSILVNANPANLGEGLPTRPKGMTMALNRLAAPLRDTWGVAIVKRGRRSDGQVFDIALY